MAFGWQTAPKNVRRVKGMLEVMCVSYNLNQHLNVNDNVILLYYNTYIVVNASSWDFEGLASDILLPKYTMLTKIVLYHNAMDPSNDDHLHHHIVDTFFT